MKAKQGQRIDTIFVLGIFCVFAAMVLTVLMLSGRIYKNMTDLSNEGSNDRTCLSYIWSRVKNEDIAGKIYIVKLQELNALCFEEEYGGKAYQTMVYLHDGYIRELFCEVGLSFMPEQGTPMMKAETFSLRERKHGVIEVATDAGSLLVYPRSRIGIPNE